MSNNDTPEVGSILRDMTLDNIWDKLVVTQVLKDRLEAKRPYTNPGKSFIILERVEVMLPLPIHIHIIR